MERLQEEIRHAVGSIILFETTDPLVKGATLMRAVVTKDLGMARIYYEFKGSREEKASLQKGLDRAKGFIRRQLASRLNLKAVPELEFFYDETEEEIAKVEGLFSKL